MYYYTILLIISIININKIFALIIFMFKMFKCIIRHIFPNYKKKLQNMSFVQKLFKRLNGPKLFNILLII